MPRRRVDVAMESGRPGAAPEGRCAPQATTNLQSNRTCASSGTVIANALTAPQTGCRAMPGWENAVAEGRATDPTAVVDERLVIAGDASVMPTITSGNTNAPAMRVAGKALR